MALLASGLAAILCLARIGVSIGRLLYSIHTGNPLAGEDALPQWYELLLEDPFFYIGIASLVFAVVSAVMSRKH